MKGANDYVIIFASDAKKRPKMYYLCTQNE